MVTLTRDTKLKVKLIFEWQFFVANYSYFCCAGKNNFKIIFRGGKGERRGNRRRRRRFFKKEDFI